MMKKFSILTIVKYHQLIEVNEVFFYGEVDVLLTQFSFAAWKGGKENKKWRTEAADEKLNTMQLQINKFNPKYIIPFASYIYFSNEENFYLNDSSNKPDQILKKIHNNSSKIIIMSPGNILGGRNQKNKQ